MPSRLSRKESHQEVREPDVDDFESTPPTLELTMTDLIKPFTRRGTVPFLHYGKPLIVTLEPGDMLAMRLEGHATVHRAPFSRIFIQLCLWTASKGHPELAE